MSEIGALSSFRELGEMSPHKRACVPLAGQLDGTRQAHNCRAPATVAAAKQFTQVAQQSRNLFAFRQSLCPATAAQEDRDATRKSHESQS